jgi:NAD(P)-dependent dehydrogenase (short-subunit alcohol dehydrogenase family)
MDGFRDQNVIVFGGTKGIGFKVVEGYYNQGARVYCLGRERSQEDLPSMGGDYPRYSPEFIHCDVTERNENSGQLKVVEVLHNIIERLGDEKIDVIVDSIGYSTRPHLKDLSLGVMEAMSDANCAYLPIALREAMEGMNRGGRIVVIGSTGPHSVKDTNNTAYAMYKAARLTAAIYLSTYAADNFGVYLCVMSPSHVATENEKKILGAERAEEVRREARESRHCNLDLSPEHVADYVLMASCRTHAPYFAGQEIFLGSNKQRPLQQLVKEIGFKQESENLSELIKTMYLSSLECLTRQIGDLSKTVGALEEENKRLKLENEMLSCAAGLTTSNRSSSANDPNKPRLGTSDYNRGFDA